MSELSPIYGWNPEIACRTLEETAFILHQSKMMSLNDVGTFIWEQFKIPSHLSGVVQAVIQEFDTTEEIATKDVQGFCDQLLERKLLIEAQTDQS